MIADLDELVRSCRSSQARGYIAEAVSCYKAGAFRSAMVSTWIAVVFDYIDKLHELHAGGDRQAGQEVATVSRFRGRLDPTALGESQTFESTLLDTAMDSFNFLTPIQHADLARLRDDRHRCAHPTLLDEESPYTPSAELARYHIRCAVDYLLSQPPVQGKAAIDRLTAEVKSEYFPESIDEILVRFQAGPLARSKDSLVTNFCIATLKLVLISDESTEFRLRGIRALDALHRMHPGVVESTLDMKLSEIVERVADDRLGRVMRLLQDFPRVLEALSEANLIRIRPYLKATAEHKPVAVILATIDIAPFRDMALSLMLDLSNDELKKLTRRSPIKEALVEAVSRYADASSYDMANSLAKDLILPNLANFDSDQIESIRQAILRNAQLIGSTYASKVVQGLIQLVSENDEDEKARWTEFHTNLKASRYVDRDLGIASAVEERFPELRAEDPIVAGE